MFLINRRGGGALASYRKRVKACSRTPIDGIVWLAQLSALTGGPPKKRLLALAVIVALGAGSAQAKNAYCQDPTTHKRISCKAA